MKSRITIIGPDVKSILSLYDDDMPVTAVTLGDTCHPSSGYVNEDLIRGVKTVSALLAFDYDFPFSPLMCCHYCCSFYIETT